MDSYLVFPLQYVATMYAKLARVPSVWNVDNGRFRSSEQLSVYVYPPTPSQNL